MQQVTSCHIYSISPGRLRDAAQLTAVQHDLHTQQKYIDTWQQTNRGADLGVIVNPQIKDNYDPSKAIPSLGGRKCACSAASKDTKPANSSTAKSQVKQSQTPRHLPRQTQPRRQRVQPHPVARKAVWTGAEQRRRRAMQSCCCCQEGSEELEQSLVSKESIAGKRR